MLWIDDDDNGGYKYNDNYDDSSAEKQSRKHLFRARSIFFPPDPFLNDRIVFLKQQQLRKKDYLLIFSFVSKTVEVTGSNPAKCWSFFFFFPYPLSNESAKCFKSSPSRRRIFTYYELIKVFPAMLLWAEQAK